MLHRKTWALSIVLVLLVAGLTGCAAGESQVAWPDREVKINIDDALAAQNAGMAGMMAGKLELTEGQLSSFLTTLLQQNTGPNFPIKEVQVFIEPDGKLYLRIQLGEGVLLGSSTIDAIGSISTEGGVVTINLDEASANGYTISGPTLDAINSQINAAIAQSGLKSVVNLSTDTGKLTLSMGGGM
jgi:hypothetical protein